MTQLEILVHTPAADALGRTLLHSLWEGTAAALALATVLSLTRSPRIRYAAASLAMLALLAITVITFLRLAPSQTSWTPPAGLHYTLNIPAQSNAPSTPNPSTPGDNAAWLAPIWIAGVLLFQLRSIASWISARRIRRTGVCTAPAKWQTRMQELGAKLRVTKPVTLLESALAEVPVVIGYLRPVVLVPVGMLTGLPEGQIEAILLHELAHIRRYDYLVNLFQLFVEGVLFYHPGVWWISNVMRTERETSCDDLVVAATGGALEYATALTTLEGRRMHSATALAATGGTLVTRVRRLLGHQERRYAGIIPILTAAILTVGVITATTTIQQPPKRQIPPPAVTVRSAPSPVVIAQVPTKLDPPTQLNPATKVTSEPLTPEQQRKNEEALKTAYIRSYKNWLDNDVVYIISDEERKAFQQLNTDPEREKFVEQFWLRRDPTPGTEENEFKQEIYRRIAFTNEHFTDKNGTAGWRTDRGRIYIQYGPPDELESHPSGRSGLSVSPNGALAISAPFEEWLYKHIDGLGANVILKFVDTTGNNEYKLYLTGNENDMLNRPIPAAPAPVK